MNEIIQQQDNSPSTSTASMVFSPQGMSQVAAFAELMASASIMLPAHLRGKPADCAAIAMQAMQWGMNPYVVAQKTHDVKGVLGYEGQLVNAVVSSSKAIRGRFKYEYEGEWSNKSHGLVRCGAVLAGESEITWGEWIDCSKVTTKNSTLWNTVPKQQAAYLAVKYWARLYCPDVLLGVYTPDELHDAPQQPVERDITPSHADALLQPEVQSEQHPESVSGEVIDDQPDHQQAFQMMIQGIQGCMSLAELEEAGSNIAAYKAQNPDAPAEILKSAKEAFKQRQAELKQQESE